MQAASVRRALRLAVGLLALCALSARADTTLEQRVKAAFLFNFAKFVSWPPEKLGDPPSPIRFCTLAQDPVADALAETIRDKTIDGHSLQVQRLDAAADPRGCHVLYVSDAGAGKAGALLRLAGSSGVLTVHDGDQPLTDGVIRFYLDERKVRFEINAAAADREQLQISSKLAGVATIVRD